MSLVEEVFISNDYEGYRAKVEDQGVSIKKKGTDKNSKEVRVKDKGELLLVDATHEPKEMIGSNI